MSYYKYFKLLRHLGTASVEARSGEVPVRIDRVGPNSQSVIDIDTGTQVLSVSMGAVYYHSDFFDVAVEEQDYGNALFVRYKPRETTKDNN